MNRTFRYALAALLCLPLVFTVSPALAEDVPQPIGPSGAHAVPLPVNPAREVLPMPRLAVKWEIGANEKIAAIDFWQDIDRQHPEFAGRRRAFAAAAAMTEQNLRSSEPHTLEEALFLLSLTKVGRDMLKGLVPKWLKGTVTFASTESPEARALDPQEKMLAQYRNGVIFWNPRGPLLTQIPALLHEGQHAVDLAGTRFEAILKEWGEKNAAYQAKYAEAQTALRAVTNATPAEREAKRTAYLAIRDQLYEMKGPLDRLQPQRDIIRLDSESRAYRGQNWIVEELGKKIPQYRDGLKEEVARRQWPGDPIDEKLFRALMKDPTYAIPDSMVDMYLRQNPWPR